MHCFRIATLCLLFASFFSLGSVNAAGGLLLFTANGSPYVNAVVYETFSSPSAHLSYITVKGGSRTQVQSQGIIANLPFPAASNASPDDAASIIAQTETYAARYPQHAKLLQGVGELWRRGAEAAKLEQSRTPAVSPATTPTQSGKSFVAPGVVTVLPVIRTKTGQQFKNARVTRFENDQASVSHSEGVTKVALADISNLPAFPPDVRAAVEKVQADYPTYKKAEDERIAESKKEQERLAKIEQKRLAKEAKNKEQERLARNEETKRSDEVLGKLAVAEQERKGSDQMSQSAKTTSNSHPAEASGEHDTPQTTENINTLTSIGLEVCTVRTSRETQQQYQQRLKGLADRSNELVSQMTDTFGRGMSNYDMGQLLDKVLGGIAGIDYNKASAFLDKVQATAQMMEMNGEAFAKYVAMQQQRYKSKGVGGLLAADAIMHASLTGRDNAAAAAKRGDIVNANIDAATAAENRLNIAYFTSNSAKVTAEIASRYDALSESQKNSLSVGGRSLKEVFQARNAAVYGSRTADADALQDQIEQSGVLGTDIRKAAASAGQTEMDIAHKTGAISTESVLAIKQMRENDIIQRMTMTRMGTDIVRAFGGGRQGAEAFAKFQRGSGVKGYSNVIFIAGRLVKELGMSESQAKAVAMQIANSYHDAADELATSEAQSGARQ
jgi:hypothetical protein